MTGARTITTDLVGCARCGREHKQVTFTQLLRPIHAGAFVFEYCAACPVTNEPILMRVTAS